MYYVIVRNEFKPENIDTESNKSLRQKLSMSFSFIKLSLTNERKTTVSPSFVKCVYHVYEYMFVDSTNQITTKKNNCILIVRLLIFRFLFFLLVLFSTIRQ